MTGSQEVIGSIPFSSILGGFLAEIAFFLFLSSAYWPGGQYGSTSSAYWPGGQYGYAGYAFGAIACGNTRFFFSGLLAMPIRPLLRLLAWRPGSTSYAYWPGGQYGYAGCAISLSLNTRNDALFRLRSIRA